MTQAAQELVHGWAVLPAARLAAPRVIGPPLHPITVVPGPLQVPATGPGGRVTKADLMAYLDSLAAAPSTVSEEVTEAVPTTAEQVCN